VSITLVLNTLEQLAASTPAGKRRKGVRMAIRAIEELRFCGTVDLADADDAHGFGPAA
jgi:hypothetical protein